MILDKSLGKLVLKKTNEQKLLIHDCMMSFGHTKVLYVKSPIQCVGGVRNDTTQVTISDPKDKGLV